MEEEEKTYSTVTFCGNCKKDQDVKDIPFGTSIKSHTHDLRCEYCGCFIHRRRIQKEGATQDASGTEAQIDRLAKFIMEEVDGEPSQNEGAVDCAIRIIKELKEQLRQKEID